jgi:4-hydroxy-2-oxoheptanedioate aldolase
MRQNLALKKWRSGAQSVGGWLSLGSVHVAEMMTHAGFDWLVVDLQHGLTDYTHLTQMLPAISTSDTTPLVRVTENRAAEIYKVLDVGAMGVIVPMVNNREEAAHAVAATKYPPQGHRSFGPIRGALYGGQGYATEANDQIACIVMIETAQGIENLESIVATPGLGGVYIGPSDLALALGLSARGDTDDPLHMATVERIRDACRARGVPVGIHTGGIDYTRRRLAQGFDFVTLGGDAVLLMQAVTRDLAAAKAAAAERSPASA